MRHERHSGASGLTPSRPGVPPTGRFKRSFCCVFLPASGYYNNGDWNDGGNNGNYWSSTENNEDNAYNLYFNENEVNADNNDNQSNNYYSVRLVQASIDCMVAPGGSRLLVFQGP